MTSAVGTARCAVTARVERAEHARYNIQSRWTRRSSQVNASGATTAVRAASWQVALPPAQSVWSDVPLQTFRPLYMDGDGAVLHPFHEQNPCAGLREGNHY